MRRCSCLALWLPMHVGGMGEEGEGEDAEPQCAVVTVPRYK